MEIEDRNLVGVEYPGRVENADNMVRTLGGLTNISKVICNKKRLDLTFRPDDVFAKPTYGDLKPASGLLLKMVYRRRRRDVPGPSTEEEEINDEPKIDVIGVVRSMFKFESLCDYQYLPIATNLATHKAEFIYDDIIPNGLLSPDWLTDDANNDIPYFFPPPSFTRVDTVQDNFFKKDRSKVLNKDQSSPFESAESTIIGMSRMRRFKHACYMPFSLTYAIPEKAQFQALKMLKFKFITNDQFNMIKEYLDRQPIWLRSSLAYETKIPRQKLKIILPSLAYYFTTGPWRLMWVRFGYDPRKDFTSRYYQTLDYRIRSNTLKEKIARSRKTRTESENTYPYFEVNRLPETRQSFYRYCDVHVPKIQEMLDKIPTPLSGAICNEKTGWLPPNFDDNCREILTETINELLESQPADFDPNQLASTSRATLAQNSEQAENEWEYGDDEEGYDDEERDQTYLDYEDEE